MAGGRSSQATSQDGKVPGQTNSSSVVHLCYSNHTRQARIMFPSKVAHFYKKDYEPFKQEPENNLMNQNFLRCQKEDDSSVLVATLFYNENVL